ncbi:maternal effect embryo arrest 47 [Hibiscus trionum]|uniref:Maternal effect embryo arrest 47 n=1 Tax=Hibiscus trionum TaxID=183268 RepID=A0A9W7H419_HIBTR|nr:maternal effect embryo arrest 47 [Hibiscus trionum]
MGFEAAEKESSRLPLFSSPHAHMAVSPERSGTLTPPSRASASVPFQWEEEPGKPKPCTTVTTFSDDFARKCLELPPRLLLLQEANNNSSKLNSPTTVLDGPYVGRTRLLSSSFRMVKSERYGSFRAGSFSPENVVRHRDDGAVVVSKRGNKGFVGSRRRGDVGGKSYVFPSCGDKGEEYGGDRIAGMRKSGTLNSSHFWASIKEGLKQVVPWSRREKKDRYINGADF